MPELPEVETVKNIISPLIKDKTITKIDIFYDRLVQSNINEFKVKLIDQTIKDVTRYGKFLFIHLTSSLVIITHLRMEGNFRYITNLSDARIKHTSLIFSKSLST